MSDVSDARRRLVKAARDAPFLEREEEHQLALRWKNDGDQAALDRLAKAHMRLVISIAARFRFYGLPIADLIQEGHIGLLEAAARFEPEREVRFSTYATWWIRASVQDYILRNWSIVRCGTSSAQKALFFNLRRLRARLSQDGSSGTSELYGRIAAAVGVSVNDVAVMDLRLSAQDSSLDATMNADEADSSTRMDFLVDDKPLPDEVAAEAIDGERRVLWLRDALRVLSDRERRIVDARRLHEGEDHTLETLGTQFGISKERVRQIETRAMEKLKRALVTEQPQAWQQRA